MSRARRRRRNRDSSSRGVGRILLWIVGVGLASFLLGYVATTVLFFPSRDRPEIVTVPDLRGSTEDAARRELSRVGLELEVGNALAHPRIPSGAVLAQEPLPGREVSPGSTIRVTLSAGRDRRTVPPLAGYTAEQARSVLEGMGFTVEVEETPSEREPGELLEVRPAPGTAVELPTAVRLVVSAGPPPVEVPSLYNLPVSAAEATLEAAGLRLGNVEYSPSPEVPLGGIHAQHPEAGSELPQGSAVDVVVSGSRMLQIPGSEMDG